MSTKNSNNEEVAYNPPPVDQEKIRADLSRNENIPLIQKSELSRFELTSRRVSQYPDDSRLLQALADRHGVKQEQIVITAGGDEAIDRTVRVCLSQSEPNRRNILTHQPTFEMFNVYAKASGGAVVGPVWMDDDFPFDEMAKQLDESVALLALVSPNNPTGRSIPFETLKKAVQLGEKHGAHVLVDLAYVEFAEVDPTDWLLGNTSVTMIRSFSKAFGMAGLRLGYALCAENGSPAENGASAENESASDKTMASKIRNIGGPFPTGQASLDLGVEALGDVERMNANVVETKQRRDVLVEMLESSGVEVFPADANFVLARYEHAEPLYEKLLKRGVAIRIFPDKPLLKNCLRITVPRTKCELGLFAKALGLESPKSMLDGKFSEMSSQNKPGKNARSAQVVRETSETKIACQINLDESAAPEISTGLGFFDHMLTALGVHSGLGLVLRCDGDLHIDDHHSVEDCGLVLGSAINEALGDRKGITRYGWALVPMDEALAQVAIDLSGRPASVVNLNLEGEQLGEVATENLTHFFQSLAVTLKCALHVDVLRGENDHHKAEGAFKGFAKALAQAVSKTGDAEIPSTKGVL